MTNENAAQVIGKVNPDLTVKVLSARDLGGNVGRYYSKSLSVTSLVEYGCADVLPQTTDSAPRLSTPPIGIKMYLPLDMENSGAQTFSTKENGRRGGSHKGYLDIRSGNHLAPTLGE